MDFLDRIGSLLTRLELCLAFHYPISSKDLRTLLTHLAPFLDGIQSMQCNQCTLPVVWQCVPREQLAKLKAIKYFQYEFDGDNGEALVQGNVNILVDWLTQPADGPKFFYDIAQDKDNGFSGQISMAIREVIFYTYILKVKPIIRFSNSLLQAIRPRSL